MQHQHQHQQQPNDFETTSFLAETTSSVAEVASEYEFRYGHEWNIPAAMELSNEYNVLYGDLAAELDRRFGNDARTFTTG